MRPTKTELAERFIRESSFIPAPSTVAKRIDITTRQAGIIVRNYKRTL
jgi:hypothetical protein